MGTVRPWIHRGRLLTLAVLSALILLLARDGLALDGVKTARVASGLNRPIFVTAAPGDYERLFIMEQRGVIKILNIVTGKVLAEPFLDIDADVTGPESSFDERGLLGLAFHPEYATNGCFFVHYSGPGGGDTVVSRFNVDPDNPDIADDTSEQILLEVEQPFSNHNGGSIAFSPIDGYLYIGLGDGGSANDPDNRAQSGSQLLGKILRIDVGDVESDEYAIPESNPFTDSAAVLDEIWAIGMRNPYRWSFDRETGDMWIGDVGQGSREEIDFQPYDSPGGENYGWRCSEGFICTGLTGCTCPDDDLTLPIIDYTHGAGRCSVTGGNIYRGGAIPDHDGVYFYADWCTAEIWVLRYDGTDVSDDEEVTSDLAPGGALTLSDIAGFGEDAWGELYIVDRGTTTTGEIYKLVPDDIQDSDCNGNFIVDAEEVALALGQDCDSNGVLDTCDELHKLTDAAGASSDQFGTSVAASGDAVIVGSPQDDGTTTNAGTAFVYRFDGVAWTVEDQLSATDSGLSDLLGNAVALDGDVAAVGARQNDQNGDNAGAVYVYRRALAGEWEFEQKLVAGLPDISADFGWAIAIEDDVIVVGTRKDNEIDSSAGAVHVFRYESGVWGEEAKLTASDADTFAEFGYSVAIRGDTIVVGARRSDVLAANAGEAYVFRYDDGAWTEVQQLFASNGGTSDEFGVSVAIGGGRLAVGAILEDTGASNAGSVYIFEQDAVTDLWTETVRLGASTPAAGDQFGIAVSLSGDLLVAGANLADRRGSDSGTIYLFAWRDGEWTEVRELGATAALGADELGTAVASAGSIVIGGARMSDIAASNAGAAFVFTLADCNTNGIHDECELATGSDPDCNKNGAIDSCELRITGDPEDQSVNAGDTAVFSVEFAGGPGATFQWRKDRIDLAGATESVLTLAEATADDAGAYDVVIVDGCLSVTSAAAELTVSEGTPFLRGDADGSGVVVPLLDGLFLLRWGFLAGPAPGCLDAADLDDSGTSVPLVDTLYILRWGFIEGTPPPAPGPETCGLDGTDGDELGCDVAPICP